MKVSLTACSTYEYQTLRSALQKSIEDLGGLEPYLKPGERVLLKVNLLMKRKPEEATTTHPEFVKALAEILHTYGVDVIIGDSPGGPYNKMALKGIYEVCGYQQFPDYVHLNDNFESAHMTCHEAKLMKHLEVIDLLTKVDKVISVSKLKTHGMTKFTGAVKNMYGTIPGLKKAEYHYTLPNIEDFSDMLVDVCLNAKPVLSFMDAIVGMEGAGPSGGVPREVGLVIASESPYHLDVIACQVVGIEPETVPTVKRCIERAIIEENYKDIEMVSESVEAHRIDDFDIPSIGGVGLLKNAPSFVDRFVNHIIRPKPLVNKDICVGCGECVLCCPAHTIELKDQKAEIHLKACIRCFCCQELCPVKAIKIYRNPIGKKLIKI